MDQSRQKAQNLREKLSQWESQLAPLSERQKDGYLQLSAAATARPLPTQVCIKHIAHLDYTIRWKTNVGDC